MKNVWNANGGIIGVGYEGETLEKLTGDLLAWGVTTLVDVRLNPLSRKPGFSKKRLSAQMASNRIAYVHMPELGNPTDNRHAYSEPDTVAGRGARDTFRDRLSQPEAENRIAEITELALHAHVAVLCFERSERLCHRHEVLTEVRDRLQRLVSA
jgi:uncharacterized protein (DUF488 family)